MKAVRLSFGVRVILVIVAKEREWLWEEER
ncbi:hypothetical protein J2Z66_003170 [Paenibacillus eucommiae]|uniref:Uncharacterized protein n=1 Tax=Paenibacillus eucommiae TaxID=1355755 RepID=A0ABS4IVF5_9BACL|nr:hypothetical protein [Paenibacillus eucommiae]